MAINWKEEHRLFSDLPPKTKRGVHAIMQDVTFKDGTATHNKTGADVTNLLDVGMRTTGEQVHRLKETNELRKHQIENGKFIFAFFKQLTTVEDRFPSLSKQDTARLMYLATFIKWETNRLQSDNGKKHYVKKDIRELVGMSADRFNAFFNRLKNEDIIREAESKELYINPTIFYRGSLKNYGYDIEDMQYTRLFRKTVRELYAEFKGRRLGQLAVIYSVIPFLNFNTNIVCYNPEETSEDLIRPMDLSRLTTLLNYKNPSDLKKRLNGIKLDGKPVFGFFENPYDRRQKRIIVNPRVVFAGDGESLKAVKAMFN